MLALLLVLLMPRSVDILTPEAFLPLLKPARYKAVYGGRGSAKSHHFADSLIDRCCMFPTRAVCVREIQTSLEESVKRLLSDKIVALGLNDQFHVMKNEIVTPGGGIIIFRGMHGQTAESLKSLEGYDVAWVEEAQNFSQTSLNLLRPTLRKKGSELWFSWNPRRATDPVDAFFRGPQGPPPNSVVVPVSYEDNPWFDDTPLKEEMEWDRRTSPQKYAHIWLGEYLLNSEAQVFKNWVVDESAQAPDHHRIFYFGLDFGFSQSPTAGVRGWMEDDRTLCVDAEVYKVRCELDDTPALLDRLGCESASRGAPCAPECSELGHGMARKYVMVADSARPETISYLNRKGYPRVRGARKGKGSVEDGVAYLQSLRIKVHPRCKRTIDELTLYSYETDPRTGQVTPVLEDEHNHIVDSLRYMTEDLRLPRKATAGLVFAR